jgi:hypothetical protein
MWDKRNGVEGLRTQRQADQPLIFRISQLFLAAIVDSSLDAWKWAYIECGNGQCVCLPAYISSVGSGSASICLHLHLRLYFVFVFQCMLLCQKNAGVDESMIQTPD